MKKLITILSLLLITYQCLGQYVYDAKKISPHVKSIVAKIEKANQIDGKCAYFGCDSTEQYKNFLTLQKHASVAELEELINHPNGAVRGYSFWALSYIPNTKTLPIILKHINDTAEVVTLFSCVQISQRVCDFMISIVSNSYLSKDNRHLTKEETAILDSSLIYTHNNLTTRYLAIERALPTLRLYPLIKKMVVTDKNLYALQPLARFRKEEDIPLILNAQFIDSNYEYLYFTYKAINNFPHQAFLPLLTNAVAFVNNHKVRYSNFDELYDAIASFRNDTAAQLLESLLANVKDAYETRYLARRILNTTQTHYTPIYNALLWELLQNHNTTNPSAFKILYLENKTKALELAQQFILSADSATYDNTYETDTTMSILLDTIKAHDKEAYKSLIQKNIIHAQYPLFYLFANRAAALKDNIIVSALFTRLKEEESPSVFEKTAKTLLSFKDKHINQQLKDFPKKQSTTYNTIGYDDLPTLLKKHGIE